MCHLTIVKDGKGFIIHQNRKVIDATYENLQADPELRMNVVDRIFLSNETLRKTIQISNDNLERQYKIFPAVQVEKLNSDTFAIRCRTGEANYIGTSVSRSDILRSEHIAKQFIELLYQDHVQLKRLANVLTELEEETIFSYTKR